MLDGQWLKQESQVIDRVTSHWPSLTVKSALTVASASSHEVSGVSLPYMVAIDHPIWPHACVLYLMTVLHAASMLKTHGWNAIYLSLNRTLCKPFWLCSPIMPRAGTKSRGWWRDYFSDHPGLKAKQTDAYTGIGQSAKAKVYCIKCFESHIHAVGAEDKIAVNAVPPRRQSVRLVDEIENYCEYSLSTLSLV